MLNRALVQNRFTLIPDRETVTVRLSRPGNDVQSVSVDDAWRKPVKFDSIQNLGLNINGTEEEWHIPDLRLNSAENGREIKPDDLIVTSETPAVTFVVLFAQLKTLRTVWVCIAQRRRS